MDKNIAPLVFAIEKSHAERGSLDSRLRAILEGLCPRELAKVVAELKDEDINRLTTELRPGVLDKAMCAVTQELGKRIQF